MWSTIKMLFALKCEESTRLVSESMDHDLTPAKRWAVRLHAISCRSCRRFRKQIDFIRHAIAQRADLDGAELESAPGLSRVARARIVRAIADHSSKDSA
jgi:hypothetical protein